MKNKGSTRTIFLDACNEISALLNDRGFKVLQKGQTLKKTSVNNDLYYKIYFQSSVQNSDWDICILPQISIYSKNLKKWKVKQSGNPYEQGIVYSNALGNISSCGYKSWNVAGMSGESKIKDIARLLNKYALPVFNLFDNVQTAVDFLKERGTCFNKHTEKSIMPLDFMIYYTAKEESELFFNDFIRSCSYRDRIISFYKELETCKNIDLNYAEFFGADSVKMAFVNGLKIK